MKDRDFLSVINNCNFRLSKGQRAIVHFINENYDKAAFMTAGKLGRKSVSAIQRLCALR